MTATSAGELLRLLQECHLLEASHVEELNRTPQALDVDVPTLTQCLVQLGWVTSYQVDQVLKGAGQLLNLGPYRVLECFGEGPLGAAFKVRHTTSKAIAVLKIIRLELLADPLVQERWQEDVQLAAKLMHPYLGQVRELQPVDGLQAYVRDYIEGTDLQTLVRQQGPMPVPHACDLIRQAAQGLHRAHMEGLTHRHVQPTNLIAVGKVNGQPSVGPVKVVDLGLGLLQEPRKPVSPTRGSSRVADIDDVRQDLEGMGRTFFFLLSGTMPSAGESLPATVPADVQTIIRGMLGTGLERFRNLSDVARALESFCASAGSAAVDIPVATAINPPPPPQAPPPPSPPPPEPPAPEAAAETPAAAADVPAVPASFFSEPGAASSAAEATPESSETVADARSPTELATPDTAAAAEESFTSAATAVAEAPSEEEETSYYVRKRQVKYGGSFWAWASLGLLLHLIALGILIYVIFLMGRGERRNKGRSEVPPQATLAAATTSLSR